MKNKKGFTLVELLVVIALLAMIVIFVVPNVVSYFKSGEKNLLSLQEKNVADAGQFYLEDFCKNPINYNFRCPLNHIDEDNQRKYFGSLKVSEILYEEYLEEVRFKEKDCSEYSYVTYDKDGKITAYLCCEYNNGVCAYNSVGWNKGDFDSSIGDE